VDLLQVDETVGRALGARLGREFNGRADRLADIAGVIVIHRPMPLRSMFYASPPSHGLHGVAAVPSDTPEAVEQAMVAVAVGLHLTGELLPSAYIDGRPSLEMPRHRAAAEFALAFMRAVPTRQQVREAPTRYRAG